MQKIHHLLKIDLSLLEKLMLEKSNLQRLTWFQRWITILERVNFALCQIKRFKGGSGHFDPSVVQSYTRPSTNGFLEIGLFERFKGVSLRFDPSVVVTTTPLIFVLIFALYATGAQYHGFHFLNHTLIREVVISPKHGNNTRPTNEASR